MKSDWCKLHSRIKRGSGLVPSNEPLRFKHIDPVFSESNAEIRLSSSAHETSFVQEDGESDDNDSNEEDSRENTIQTYEQIEAVDNEDVDNTDDQYQNFSQGSQDEPHLSSVNQGAPEKKCKAVVAPHKKSKQIRSNEQDASEVASGLKALADSSIRQNQITIEAERKRKERYMDFR